MTINLKPDNGGIDLNTSSSITSFVLKDGQKCYTGNFKAQNNQYCRQPHAPTIIVLLLLFSKKTLQHSTGNKRDLLTKRSHFVHQWSSLDLQTEEGVKLMFPH